MSEIIDISVGLTEERVEINATPNVIEVNIVTGSAINPASYDLADFTNTSANPFVQYNALIGYTPTSRALTINGVTQDLTADRSWTISTGITVGTTPIVSGTVGRVLFEGTGNVVQESANLFWDNTNGRLGIGGTPGAFKLDIVGTSSANIIGVKVRNTSTNGYTEINCYNNTGGDNDRVYFGVGGTATGDVYQNRGYFISSLALEGITFTAGKTTTGDMRFFTGGNNERLRIFGNGNVGINTTTDAGFKLDVNGTARVQNEFRVKRTNATAILDEFNTNSATSCLWLTSTKTTSSFSIAGEGTNTLINAPSGYVGFFQGLAEKARFASATGNLLINTTTDAGFKLDVNGTARFVGAVSIGSPNINDKLEVYGNILIRANDRIRLAGTSDGNTALWANSGSSAQMNVKNGSGSAFDITFGSIGSTTRMLRIHSYDSTTPSVVVGNNATAFASSVLTVESTTQGFLPPRMTTTQRNAIASPAAGLMVYDTTLNVISFYNGTIWL
jgi:hypothetical protein